ncbi:MAG: hypothetical protein JWM58_2981 [Rhizobium sp.]|jgi:hypothetical protein|nr:hypothetical protein [Rhizobium sp.]
MRAAFVVMSILGCDDSGVQCQPVASVAQEWQTIAACDSASESVLVKYKNVDYPMVVAVCQTAGTTALADSEADALENRADTVTRALAPIPPVAQKEDKRGLTARAIALVKYTIPTKKGLKSTIAMPVHFVTDAYSWVARKVGD